MSDWIDAIEHFNTFGKYPLATVVHIGIGMWCGRQLALAHIDKHVSRAISAAVVFVGWLAYEISEFARIHDDVDIDIANGLGAKLIGITVTTLYRRLRRTRHENP